ncbi:apolipoprotein D-like [Rhinoraja longicauda]
MQLLYLTLLLALCSHATAIWGGCKNQVVQENFTMAKYLGTWYEIETSEETEVENRCLMEKYKAIGTDKVALLTQFILDDGIVTIREGEMFNDSNTANPAKMYFRISQDLDLWRMQDIRPSSSFVMKYWVLDTDYTTYSLVYSCISVLGISHSNHVWILGKKRHLSNNVTDYLHEKLISNNIKVKKLYQIDQNNCEMNF